MPSRLHDWTKAMETCPHLIQKEMSLSLCAAYPWRRPLSDRLPVGERVCLRLRLDGTDLEPGMGLRNAPGLPLRLRFARSGWINATSTTGASECFTNYHYSDTFLPRRLNRAEVTAWNACSPYITAHRKL